MKNLLFRWKLITLTSYLISSPFLLFTQDFEVAPVVMKFQVNPGEIEVRKLNIKNHANKEQLFNFILADYDVDESGKKIRSEAGTSPNSCANMITLNPSYIVLQPNEEAKVDVVMTVPPNKIKSKWGMIYVQATEEQSLEDVDKQMKTGINIKPRIAVIVTQSPKINNNYGAKISSLLELDSENDSIRKFSATITNTGDKIVDAKINLVLADLTTAKEIKINSYKHKLYPNQSKIVYFELPKSFSTPNHVLTAILDIGHGSLKGTQIMLKD